jgi:sugar/nucleoside kinase (ribokinase family)
MCFSTLLVIGLTSLDVLHFPAATGQASHAPGGAGLYTALAARRAGATVTLLAPKPQPIPELLQPANDRLHWRGPDISPADLPRLEIAHHGDGRATLLHATWGAEARLSPEYLPEDLSGFAWVHIAALSSAHRQMEFLRACRERGAARLSVGTYARLAYGETETVRALLAQADAFFMNENEANGIFGSIESARPQPAQLLFITQGERGAWVLEGESRTHLPAPHVTELDPTGAGDTFCGVTLARLALSDSPLEAARYGIALASEMITAVGPAALLA